MLPNGYVKVTCGRGMETAGVQAIARHISVSARSQADLISPRRPLAGDPLLTLRTPACLAVRAGTAACRACGDACPAKALSVDGDGPRLVADCLHCGRCAAACPTGALEAVGFDVVPHSGTGTVRVECAKAPIEARSGEVRVPCLGGIAPGLLLRWWQLAGEHPLTLVDRGWCGGCSAGGEAFAGGALLQRTNAWLQECGVPPERWPSCSAIDHSAHAMPRDIPEVTRRAVMSRRGFFRRVSTEVGREEQVASVPSGPRARLRRAPCALPAREQILDTLRTIAEAQGRDMPASALPAISVRERCADHGICVGVCPTGALRRATQDGRSELQFDAARCVSCHRCETACPEQAIQLGIGGASSPVTVHRATSRACVQCGTAFPAHAQGAFCRRCSTTVALARSLFGTNVAGQ